MTERDDETRKDLGIHREPEILVTDASAKNTSMVHHIVGSLLIPSQMPIMEADNNNTYDLDTQIQELLTDYYEAHTNHSLGTSTWSDLRLSSEIVRWVKRKYICINFIILKHQDVLQTVNDLLARPLVLLPLSLLIPCVRPIQVDDTFPINRT